MPTPQEKIEELKVELNQTVQQFNQSSQVVTNCKVRINELQGGIAALKSLEESEKPVTSLES